MELPLYKTSSNMLYPADIQEALCQVGIEDGDHILIHSDISVLGKIATLDRDYFLNAIVEQLAKAVGQSGTLIMPTFSYSFCKNEIFDIVNTKSTVGTLTEFFRQQSGVARTKHPIFSAAIRGAKQEYFLDVGKDSFDNESIFGKLRQMTGKIVFFGVNLAACTYVHHIEQLYGVNYRYLKTFSGQVHCNDHTYNDSATFFVRYLDRIVELDVSRLENYLLKNNIMRSSSLGKGKILAVNAQDLFNATVELLDNDPYYLLSPRSTRM
jgi:aminoglycoside 3-N-acetyltransferase